jgi:putative glycosyltransferase epsH
MSVEVSIVVPCYNCQDTIRECYNSIKKSVNNVLSHEIILINDGSTDNTQHVLKEIITNDNNVIVINQENKGVSAARNMGLKNAKGKYISFVDSDDSILEEYYTKMIVPMEENSNLDLIICDYSSSGLSNEDILNISIDNIYEEGLKSKGSFEKLRGYIWNKIYKRNILVDNNIVFDEEVKFCEDLGFNLIYLKYAENVKIISEKLYRYDTQTTDASGNSSKKSTAFKIWDNLLSRENEEKYKNVIKLEKYKYMIWGLCEQLSEKGEIQNKEYLDLLKKEKDFIIENKSLLGRKFELLFRLMMISPIFVKCFYRIL